jgi:hypothetical protein
MLKHVATVTMDGKRKRGRPCKRWRDEVEGDLNTNWNKSRLGQRAAWKKILFEASIHNGL